MIVKNIVKIELQALTAAILQQFPNTGIEQRGSKLTIEDVEDTQANNDKIDAVIAGHDCDVAITALKKAAIKEQSSTVIAKSDFIRGRQGEQKELIAKGKMSKTTLTDAEYVNWLVYRQALRDFPDVCDLENPIWPTEPT